MRRQLGLFAEDDVAAGGDEAAEEPAAPPENGLAPYLKWAGGKRRVVPALRPHLAPPRPGMRLVEPFAGSACVTLALGAGFDSLWLNDRNDDLANLHRRVAVETESLARELETLFVPDYNVADRYYAFRREFNADRGSLRGAALFVYLNRHGFNGLCRYSGAGFNVPFGRYDRPAAPIPEIREAAGLLARARITSLDFREVLGECRDGDVVYCDPPYVPLSKTASFTRYATADFAARDQEDLVREAAAAASRGARVVVSNHDTDETRRLYAGATLHAIRVRRSISQNAATRGDVGELIAVYGDSPAG